MADEDFFPVRRPTDEEGYVVNVARDQGRFMYGRAGDHWMTRFQCDLCHFRNINLCSPLATGEDDFLLMFIRRANLDALWSREPGTVNNTRREFVNLRNKASHLRIKLDRMLPPMGPWPVRDDQGMAIAVCILLRSLDPGKNEATIQFSTTTKMRTAFANVWRASVNGGDDAVISQNTVKMHHTSCPTHGEWFTRWSKGMHERMGDLVKPDLAISIAQMLALMENFETRWKDAVTREQKRWVVFPALFSVIAFCCGLRGEELPLMSLSGVRRHLRRGLEHPTMPHVVVALLGRFKTEISQKYHLMPLVLETNSGLQPGLWITRMVTWYEEEGIVRGWVFRNFKNGEPSRARDYEYDILTELENIQRKSPEIIDEKINVFEEFGVSRSFRRGSDTQALIQGVPISVIERNNRWRSVENAGSKRVNLRMVHHYEEVSLMLKTLLGYSGPL